MSIGHPMENKDNHLEVSDLFAYLHVLGEYYLLKYLILNKLRQVNFRPGSVYAEMYQIRSLISKGTISVVTTLSGREWASEWICEQEGSERFVGTENNVPMLYDRHMSFYSHISLYNAQYQD